MKQTANVRTEILIYLRCFLYTFVLFRLGCRFSFCTQMGAQTGREYKEMNTEVCECSPQSKSEKNVNFC